MNVLFSNLVLKQDHSKHLFFLFRVKGKSIVFNSFFHTFPSYIPWVPEIFSLACSGMPCCRPTHFRPKSLHRKLCVESLLRSEFFGRILLVFWLGVLTVCMREK